MEKPLVEPRVPPHPPAAPSQMLFVILPFFKVVFGQSRVLL